MSAAMVLARRNLAQNRTRLLVSTGGIALAMSLVLALNAIFAGVANQLTAYVDRAGADVWVSQAGVQNLHMVASTIPATVTDAVRRVDGVATAEPILEATDTIAAGDERAVAYVIGLPTSASMGGPWDVVAGAASVASGEIIVDQGFASKAGIGIGDRVKVLGGEARVVGLSRGTASLLNSVAFVSIDDFRAARGGADVVSFVLVKIAPGASPELVARAIARDVAGVSAQTTETFASQERSLVMDMSADVISIMDGIGFAVGLAVVALTVYVATLSRRREYGSLKAVGVSNRFLYAVVVVQAGISALLGFVAAVAFTSVLALIVPRVGVDLELSITTESLIKVIAAGTAIAAISALLPIRAIAHLDPASVFRRGATT